MGSDELELLTTRNRCFSGRVDSLDANRLMPLAQQPDDDAERLLRQAISLRPEQAQLHVDLGRLIGTTGRDAEAAEAFAAALRLEPDRADILTWLAIALEKLGRLADAATTYRKAIEVDPIYFPALHGIGQTLRKMGRLDAALAYQHRLVALRPDFAEGIKSLGITYVELGLQTEANMSFRKVTDLQSKSASAMSCLIYTMHYDAACSPQAIFDSHRLWAERHAGGPGLGENSPSFDNGPDSRRRLRIGYVSPDLFEHPIARFIEPALQHYDRSAFHVTCFSCVRKPDEVTRRIRAFVDDWHDVATLSDPQAARLVQELRIDVLVDLAGHGADHRLTLFARKPAPVQVTFLGYPDTTGMRAVDYRLTDGWQDPPRMTEHLHAERVARLDRCSFCYRPDDQVPPVAPPPAIGRGYITFGCLNKLIKVTPPALEMWRRILRQVAGSKLLLSIKGGDEHNPSIRRRLEAAGLPSDRLILLDKTPNRWSYLERFAQIDISLDTFPYHGATTTCDSLWMGVPVITLAGPTNVARAGVSILSAAGLPELIASAPTDYVRIAVELAGDHPRLDALRRRLREQMRHSPLRDETGFAKSVGDAYRSMWVRWCGQNRGPLV
jgi:protein O-GlcNAc transferase